MPSIADNVASVRREIADACSRVGRPLSDVRLIAVTKAHGPDVLSPLAAAGVQDIGENRCDHQALMRAAAPAGMRVHAIGRIQSRQLADLVPLSDCLHSLCDLDHLQRLAKVCASLGRPLPVFVQVNTSAEASKAGLRPEALAGFLAAAAQHHNHLTVLGLMTMAPARSIGADDTAIRACFRALASLARQHGLERLSMGMSDDFSIAVEEGATDVRIGTRLFA